MSEQTIITIFCAFTRQWAVERWLGDLANTEHNPDFTNLCFIVDMNDEYLVKQLRAFAESHHYRSFHVKINEDWQPNETRIAIRRQRVADIKNQSKELIAKTDGSIIIGLEDDTVFERMPSFGRLIQPILDDDKIGFVEGVQMGRWGANMLGVWDCDDFEYPQKVWTLLPPAIGQSPDRVLTKFRDAEGGVYQDITGGGFYGYATQRELYMKHDYYWSSGQPWGPDVNYGFWLRQRGYRCVVDWQTIFGHNDHGQIGWPDAPPRSPLVEIIYNRDTLTGKWERRDYEQGRN